MGNGESDKVKIFVTHKHDEEEQVMKVTKTLQRFGGSRIEFEFAEHMPAGEDLRTWILRKVSESNLLLFLMTKPDQDLSWCIYEAGVFETVNDEDTTKRVILLHSPAAKVPTPLNNMKVVKAEQKPMEHFVRQFFGTDELTGKPPLNLEFNTDRELVTSTAKEIRKQFVPVEAQKWTTYCNRYIELQISDPEAIKENGLPPETIINSDGDLRDLFGLIKIAPDGTERRTWGELQAKLNSESRRWGNVDDRWCDELLNAIYKWITSNTAPPVRAVFWAENGKRYLPVLSRLDIKRDQSRCIHIDFVEQVSVPALEFTPDRFASLLSCLILGNRLEFEVCRRHLDDVDFLSADAKAIEELRKQIGQNIANIEAEAEFRKEAELTEDLAIDRLVSALQPNGEAEVVAESLKEQGTIKNLLKGKGSLTADELKKQLELLRELNQDVMVRASKRYAELLEKEFDVFASSHEIKTADEARVQ